MTSACCSSVDTFFSCRGRIWMAYHCGVATILPGDPHSCCATAYIASPSESHPVTRNTEHHKTTLDAGQRCVAGHQEPILPNSFGRAGFVVRRVRACRCPVLPLVDFHLRASKELPLLSVCRARPGN